MVDQCGLLACNVAGGSGDDTQLDQIDPPSQALLDSLGGPLAGNRVSLLDADQRLPGADSDRRRRSAVEDQMGIGLEQQGILLAGRFPLVPLTTTIGRVRPATDRSFSATGKAPPPRPSSPLCSTSAMRLPAISSPSG